MSSQIQQLGIRYWFRVLLTVLFCISTVWFGIHQSYGWLGISLCLLVLSII
ncbi:ATP-binding protein, partial [Bacteroides ovatus]